MKNYGKIGLIIVLIVLTNLVTLIVSKNMRKNESDTEIAEKEKEIISINNDKIVEDSNINLIKTVITKENNHTIKVEYYLKKCGVNECDDNFNLNYEYENEKIPTYRLDQRLYLNDNILWRLDGTIKYIYEKNINIEVLNKEIEEDYLNHYLNYKVFRDNYFIFYKSDLEENLPMDGEDNIYIFDKNGKYILRENVLNFVSIITDKNDCSDKECFKNSQMYIKYGNKAPSVNISEDYIYYLISYNDNEYAEFKLIEDNGTLKKEIIQKYSKNSEKIIVGIFE